MVLPDVYLEHDKPDVLYARAGLDARGIVAKVFESLGRERVEELGRREGADPFSPCGRRWPVRAG